MAKQHPTTRIWDVANKRADEIVLAFKAQGIETTKAAFISQLIMEMPIPQPKKATPKAAEVTTKTKRSKATVHAAVPAAL